MGRWSRLVARDFVDWLSAPPGLAWLDVGCGVGALTGAILARSRPARVAALDPSEGFLAYVADRVRDPVVSFRQGEAQGLPFDDAAFDVAVAGLVLNFVASPGSALAEMRRVLRRGGRTAVYVWEYADGMQFLRRFWDAATALDGLAADLDEARRFPVCNPDRMVAHFRSEGFDGVECRSFDVQTAFADFDDFWSPFLGGQCPAPSYVGRLAEPQREALRERLRATLPSGSDGTVSLTARAFALRGVRGA